jgi:hypothetical protein
MKSKLPLIIAVAGLTITSATVNSQAFADAPMSKNPIAVNDDKLPHKQQYIAPQSKQLNKPSTSQEVWEQFRQQQDQTMLQQQQRLNQFYLEDQLRQQEFAQPEGSQMEQQSEQLTIDQLAQQQKQELDILKLQQELSKP